MRHPAERAGWFEDDAFWRDLYPYMFPAERFAAAPGDVERAIALAGCEAGAVLDLCCGPGRHSVEFARRGFDVTGVDRSAFLLARARERAEAAGVECRWIAKDMRRFRRAGAFRLACSFYTSFGYFEDEADNFTVLRNVYLSLRKGGVFVMEMLGKERLARVWKDSLCAEHADGALVLQRPGVLRDWTRLHNEWTVIKDGACRTYSFEHSIYSGRELKQLLLRAGFSDVRLYGGLDGSPYNLDAQRLVAVASRL